MVLTIKLHLISFIFFLNLNIVTNGKRVICPKGMKYRKCERKCLKTCPNLHKSKQKCLYRCYHYQCQCKKDHYLTSKYKCVKKRNCPKKIKTTTDRPTTTPWCPRNQIYTKCKAPCQRTCNELHIWKPCFFKCVGEGCDCKFPNVISHEKKCIRIFDCRKYRYPFLQSVLKKDLDSNDSSNNNQKI